MTRRTTHGIVSSLAVAATLATAVATAEDSLSQARELYAAASYEEALAALNHLRAAGLAVEDGPAVEQYRAFCLLALGRATEAEDAIAAVVTAVPLYSPSEADVSPRLRSAFSAVRRRVLPTVVQQKYGEAKAAFDRKDYVAAEGGFAQVLRVLADPDMTLMANQPPLADLRTLAKGFQDLSAVAAVPLPDPAPALPEPQPASNPPPHPKSVYTVADTNVMQPVIVRQSLPPTQLGRKAQGIVEVVIDEKGSVEMALIRESIDQAYDSRALEAIRKWRYKPATRDGVPVKFRKLVQIKIAS